MADLDSIKAVEREVQSRVELAKSESLRAISEARSRRDAIFRKKRGLAEEKVKTTVDSAVKEAEVKAKRILGDSDSGIMKLGTISRSKFDDALRIVLSEMGV